MSSMRPGPRARARAPGFGPRASFLRLQALGRAPARPSPARAIRRSAASAFGIWRNDAGSNGRQARQPATSHAETSRSRAPTPARSRSARMPATGRPTATASRHRPPAGGRPSQRRERRRAAAAARPPPARARPPTPGPAPTARASRDVRVERLDIRGQQRLGHPERAPDRPGLRVERGAPLEPETGSSHASATAIVESISVAWTHSESSGSRAA